MAASITTRAGRGDGRSGGRLRRAPASPQGWSWRNANTHTDTHLQITSRSCRPAALLDAARTGNTDEVLALLRRPTDPVDVNGASDDGSTALIVAAEKGHPATVAALAEAGAAVNAGDSLGWTPLHFAAVNNHAECARVLVQAGATVDVRDRVGWTPLHMAAMNGNTEASCALVELGASLDAVNEYQLGVVHVAARRWVVACTASRRFAPGYYPPFISCPG